jgi:hypothetical protein
MSEILDYMDVDEAMLIVVGLAKLAPVDLTDNEQLAIRTVEEYAARGQR